MLFRAALLLAPLLLLGGCSANSPAAEPATRPIPAPPAPATLRVMTFNVRYATANDGVNSWTNRRDLFLRTIRSHEPDLLGCQEVLDIQAQFLRQSLPDYGFVGTGRDDGKTRGEYSPILYRRDRFELLDSGQFWLSPTPERVGVKGWDAALPRICTWAQLRLRESGQLIWYFNSHWDHVGTTARAESGRLIRQTIAARVGPSVAVIVTGDFNSTEREPGYQALVAPSIDGSTLLDAYRQVHPTREPQEATLHDFKGTLIGERIDHILLGPQFRAVRAEIERSHEGQVYPSDHYPVIAELLLSPAPLDNP
jgi:endonuclease/exonuclease/phosphatase family metal-dependent hydrolase